MADTNPVYEIPPEWTNINELTGIPVGTEILLQNVGYPGEIISVATSGMEPDSGFKGIALDQIKEFLAITAGESIVWCRFYRIDGTTPNSGRIGELQVQVI